MVAFVLDRRHRVRPTDADREPVSAIIRLGPPAVEDREVERAVEHGLLARRAARLLGAPWVVQPDVDPLNQAPPDVHVVVFDEHDVSREPLVAGDLDDALDQFLAHPVLGVGLAGEDELDRPIRRSDDVDHPVHVLKDQAGPLVGREPAGEADRQGVGVEHVGEPLGRRVGLVAALRLGEQPRPARN